MMDQAELIAQDNQDPLDFLKAKEIADTLMQHYPGHLWAVNVTQGLANVLNLKLSGKWGFRIKLPAIYSASELKRQVILAGGELLERYRQRRGVVNEDALLCEPTDFAGNLTPEL